MAQKYGLRSKYRACLADFVTSDHIASTVAAGNADGPYDAYHRIRIHGVRGFNNSDSPNNRTAL